MRGKLPAFHFDIFVLALVAGGTFWATRYYAIGCADDEVVRRAVDIVREGTEAASNATFHLIETVSRSQDALHCKAQARIEYPAKDSDHRTVDYEVATSRWGRLADVNATIRPEGE